MPNPTPGACPSEITHLRDENELLKSTLTRKTKDAEAWMAVADERYTEITRLRELFHGFISLRAELEAAQVERDHLKSANDLLTKMADAAERWYWAENSARLDTAGSIGHVFDALRLLGRYPSRYELELPVDIIERKISATKRPVKPRDAE